MPLEHSEEEEERECELCSDVPEKVIHLACEHIICLECATKLIFQNKNMEDIDLSELQCGVCQETTPLSEEVQETIIEFLNKGVEEGHFQLEEEGEEDEQEKRSQISSEKKNNLEIPEASNSKRKERGKDKSENTMQEESDVHDGHEEEDEGEGQDEEEEEQNDQ